MLRRAYDFIRVHPWAIIPPGAAIAITVFCFNAVGDGLRAALGTGTRTRRQGRLGLTTVKGAAPPAPPIPSSADLLAVDGLTLGLVGESGSGKTVTSLSIMRLLPSPPATITAGSVLFEGRDLLRLSFNDMARLRGNDLAMVFQ